MSIEPAGCTPDADSPTVGDGPTVVVTAIDLKESGREALAQRLGPGHVVVDIRDAGNSADIVLIPPASRQLVGGLRRIFPDAQLLITEFTDPEFGADFSGPVQDSVESGVDGYFVVPTMDELVTVTRHAGSRPDGRGLTPGPGTTEQASIGAEPGALQLDPVHDTHSAPVRLDLRRWAGETKIDAVPLTQLAWPLLLQLRRQIRITVVGIEGPEWISRAEDAGIDAEP